MRLAREGLSTPTLWPGPGKVPGVPGLAEGPAVAGRVGGGDSGPGAGAGSCALSRSPVQIPLYL